MRILRRRPAFLWQGMIRRSMGTTRTIGRTVCSRGSTSRSMWGARPRRLYKTVLRTWWRTGWTLHRQAFLQRPAFSRRLCQRTLHRPAFLQRPAFIRRLCQRKGFIVPCANERPSTMGGPAARQEVLQTRIGNSTAGYEERNPKVESSSCTDSTWNGKAF